MNRITITRRTRLTGLGVAGVLALTACSPGSDSDSAEPEAATATASETTAPAAEPASESSEVEPPPTDPPADTAEPTVATDAAVEESPTTELDDTESSTTGSAFTGCDGDFRGSYTGDDAGEISGRVADGTFLVSFDSDLVDLTVDAVGTIDADGRVEGRANTGASSTGQVDTGTCVIEGEWENDGLVGTWSVEPVNDADTATAVTDEDATADTVEEGCSVGQDFRGQELILEDFEGDLRCADFSLSTHSQTSFIDAVLDGATFSSADLAQTTFVTTSMRDVDLRGAGLAQVSFTDVDLTGAQTGGVQNAQSTFTNTTCPDGTNSDDNGGTCDLG